MAESKYCRDWKIAECLERMPRVGAGSRRRQAWRAGRPAAAQYFTIWEISVIPFSPLRLYDLEKQLGVILAAVGEQGIEARFTGRNDITVCDGRKFSGNAFRFSSGKGLMHGTLLLDTNPEKIARYLQVSKAKMQAKGIDSCAHAS